MSITQFIIQFVLGAFAAAVVGVACWRNLRDGQGNPFAKAFKVLFTAVLLFLIFGAYPYLMKGGAGEYSVAFTVGLGSAVVGIVLSILWTRDLITWVMRPFTSALDGGDEEPELKPLYSAAKALAGRGNVEGSIAAIQEQLRRFPGDHEGLLLLAETQALILHDLPAAEATIQQLCESPGKKPGQVAAALTALADWYLKVTQDVVSARRCFQQIRDAFPNTELDTNAAQRIAHLGDGSFLPGAARRKYVVAEGVHNLGLHGDPEGRIKLKETSPAEQTTQLIQHLQEHPLDTEAREQLAQLYVEHYHRLDMAVLQYEELLALPNEPARLKVRWLNKLADLHVAAGDDPAPARACLKRIVDGFKGTAMADLAQTRIEKLALEFKAKEKSQAVKLGSYEQNIGLKYGPPKKQGY